MMKKIPVREDDKKFDYEAWKKSGKPNRAPAGFGKNGFATKLMQTNKKSD